MLFTFTGIPSKMLSQAWLLEPHQAMGNAVDLAGLQAPKPEKKVVRYDHLVNYLASKKGVKEHLIVCFLNYTTLNLYKALLISHVR